MCNKDNKLNEIIEEFKLTVDELEQKEALSFTNRCMRLLITLKSNKLEMTNDEIFKVVNENYPRELIAKYGIDELLSSNFDLLKILDFGRKVNVIGGSWGSYFKDKDFIVAYDNARQSYVDGVLENCVYTNINNNGNRNVKVSVRNLDDKAKVRDALDRIVYTYGERFYNFRPYIFNELGIYYKDFCIHNLEGSIYTYHPSTKKVIANVKLLAGE